MGKFYKGNFCIGNTPNIFNLMSRSDYNDEFEFVNPENEIIPCKDIINNYIAENFDLFKDSYVPVSEDIKEILDVLTQRTIIRFKKHNTKDTFVFEIIKDENDNLFGKEIITGLVFPLVSLKNMSKGYALSNYYVDDEMVKYNFGSILRLIIRYENSIPIMDKAESYVNLLCEATPEEVQDYVDIHYETIDIFRTRTKLLKKLNRYNKKNQFNSEVKEKEEGYTRKLSKIDF